MTLARRGTRLAAAPHRWALAEGDDGLVAPSDTRFAQRRGTRTHVRHALLALVALLPTLAAQDIPPVQALNHRALDSVTWVQSSAEWEALTRQAYTAASTSLREALDDTSITAAIEQTSGADALPPAVILDVDETVLDNSFYQARLIRDGGRYGSATWNAWCEEVVAPPIPGALAFCQEAAALGVTVFYVTNRRDNLREVTRQNLELFDFPFTDGVETVLTRGDSSDKAARRSDIAANYRIVMLVGDNLGDFASVFRDESPDERRQLVAKYGDMWGRQWIVLPNPMYGDWMGAIMGYDFNQTPLTELKRMHGALRPDSVLDGADTGASAPRLFKSLGVVPPKTAALPSWESSVETTTAAAANSLEALELDLNVHPKLSSGPLLGYATMTEVAVWVQTRGSTDVQFLYRSTASDAATRLTPLIRTDAAGDHIARFTLADLTPDSEYQLDLFLDGERVELGVPVVARTQAQWKWHKGPDGQPHSPPDFTFAFGSCSYINDPPFDRPNDSYGGGYEIFDTIADVAPAFMLWVGDNVYFREAETFSEAAMRRRYRVDRSTPELQRLLGATHHFATWDDHDYGPNDSDRSFPLRDESAEIFADYWPTVALGDGERGVNQRFTWADCEFFLLDDRTWRAPNNAPPSPEKCMFGDAQMQWLRDALVSSTATFKFIVNGNQVTNEVAPYESFRHFPDEQRKLFDFLHEARIEGVVFLSGDRHHSELLELTYREGYPWYEFTSSPLAAGVHTSSAEDDNPMRVDGTRINDRRSFGRVSVRGTWGARALEMAAVDTEGTEIWSVTVPARALRFDG